MSADNITKCRCCDDPKLVGWQGLCQKCSDAVDRFLTQRRQNLKSRK